jgi:putative thioredoxin
MIELNETNFQTEVIEKSKTVPVLVDFWANWCMPCRMLGPVLEKLETTYAGKFALVKVNVDTNQEIAAKYAIMSIPNVKLFKNGMPVDEFIGALPEQSVKSFLTKHGI